jgi:tripartite-type tricarboxylate transporter receptor subunit TctC
MRSQHFFRCGARAVVSRRALIGLGLLFAALSTQVHAQSTPKTVTLVVPYAAGGGTDTVSRLIGERMSRGGV